MALPIVSVFSLVVHSIPDIDFSGGGALCHHEVARG